MYTHVCIAVGKMEFYDNRWIMNATVDECDGSSSSPATLGLTNMAGRHYKLYISHIIYLLFLLFGTIFGFKMWYHMKTCR